MAIGPYKSKFSEADEATKFLTFDQIDELRRKGYWFDSVNDCLNDVIVPLLTGKETVEQIVEKCKRDLKDQ